MLPVSYAPHQYPPEIIRHAVWLYLRFTLSYRGIETTYERVRRWVLKFGPIVARNLRRLRPRPAGTWHLDEMVVAIQGRRRYLWRPDPPQVSRFAQQGRPPSGHRLGPALLDRHVLRHAVEHLTHARTMILLCTPQLRASLRKGLHQHQQ